MSRRLGATRVAIIEVHTLFAEALDVALTFEGHDVHRVAPGTETFASTPALLNAVLRVRASVVLLDLGLGEAGSGLPLIRPLTRSGAHVVIITGSADRVLWGEALRAGACTVLSKSEPLNTVLATIRHLGEGRAVMSRPDRERLMADFLRDRSEVHDLRRQLDTLTPRERQVLALLMQGRSVREIAKAWVVSEATVRTQVRSILAKLQVSSQLAAVGMAHRVGTFSADVVA